ncbi:MAG: class I SAM-dependent methyltransferase [Terriglobia bacterium]|jgi:ubiquinone/menaquinone biosynthesis C-methylase UbiE
MSKKHKETVQKQFTKTADAFAKFAVRDSLEVLAEKVEFAKPQAHELVLDVACGPGAFVLAVAPRVRFALGIDLTPEMVRQARQFQAEKQIANAVVLRGDADSLPFPDACFDLVSCQHAFHHITKPEPVLEEMIRVTKPEGRLLILDPLAPESDAKFELYNQIERLRDPSHTCSLRLTSFLSMFEEHGLEVSRQSLRRRPRSFNHWMQRAGLVPGKKHYAETRKQVEESMPGDKAGFSARVDGDDIQIIHNEGMFLARRLPADGP